MKRQKHLIAVFALAFRASYIDVANIHHVAEFDHATMNVKPYKKHRTN